MSNTFDAKLAIQNSQAQEEEDEFSQPTLTKEQILQQKVLQQQKKEEETLRKRKELEQKIDKETKDAAISSKRNGLFDDDEPVVAPQPKKSPTPPKSINNTTTSSTTTTSPTPKQETSTPVVPTTVEVKTSQSTVSKPNKVSNLFDEDDGLFSNASNSAPKNLAQAFDQTVKPVSQVTTSLKDLDINDDDLDEIEKLISTKNLPTLSKTSTVSKQTITTSAPKPTVKSVQIDEDLDEDLFAAPTSKSKASTNLFQDLDSYIAKNKSNTKTSSSLFDD